MRSAAARKSLPGKIGKKELVIIHIAKAQCGWTDAEYRHVLKDGFGVSSSKELTSKQADKLMALFKADGFQIVSRPKKAAHAQENRSANEGNWDRIPMLKKIGAILGDLKKTEAYADAIARRMFHVDAYRWCDPDQLHKIIAALEYTRNKMNGEGPTESMGRKLKKVRKSQREAKSAAGKEASH
jgi:phage gp16-like protein